MKFKNYLRDINIIEKLNLEVKKHFRLLVQQKKAVQENRNDFLFNNLYVSSIRGNLSENYWNFQRCGRLVLISDKTISPSHFSYLIKTC